MEDINYLENLVQLYRRKAAESGDWINYVKAHGLANACVVRCPTVDRLQQVYDIEKSWYKGSHPLKFAEHQALTELQKRLVAAYRENTKKDLEMLKPDEKALDINDVFSETNMHNAKEFSQSVFKTSVKCTAEFVQIACNIIESSVKILGNFGLAIPCALAVIGMGSVARGEATPYSDLEYAFIVESDENVDYFVRLAVDSYFRLANLGETPLHSFDIKELSAKDGEGNLLFVDQDSKAGFRFDGITEWSGNVPTGNGPRYGKWLIRTVKDFMGFYKEELMSAIGELSDLSDFLSSTVLIYSNDGGAEVYNEFLTARLAYEQEVARFHLFVHQKRLHTMSADIVKYNFLPEFDHSYMGLKLNTNVQVKADIFRYPTLLATNLRIFLILESANPWDTYSELCRMGILSEGNLRYMEIVLALAIYIRTSAYMALGTQSVMLSLYTPSLATSQATDRYYLPRNLFVTIGCLLVPIKQSIRSFLARAHRQGRNDAVDMVGFMKSLVREFRVSKSDFMLKAEVLYFAGDHQTAVDQLNRALGSNTLINFPKFIEAIRDNYGTTKSDGRERKYILLCSYLLYSVSNYQSTMEYMSWLITYETSRIHIAMYKMYIADCMNKTQNSGAARTLLNQSISLVQQDLGLSFDQSLPEHILSKLGTGQDVTHRMIHTFHVSESLYLTLGTALQALGSLDQSIQCFHTSLDIIEGIAERTTDTVKQAICRDKMARVSVSLGDFYIGVYEYEMALHYYTKAYNTMTDIYGMTTNHADIATIRNSIANVRFAMGEHDTALNHYMGALGMYISLYGENNCHQDIARNYYNVGIVYAKKGNTAASIEYYNKALGMYKSIHGKHSTHPDIADSYNNLGCVYLASREYAISLKYFAIVLDMRKATYGAATNHPDIANTYSYIGAGYYLQGEYTKSLEYYAKAFDMRKFVYGVDTIHPQIGDSYYKIGEVYSQTGHYTKALDQFTKAIKVIQAMYGQDTNHYDAGRGWKNIADLYVKVGRYSDAFTYLNHILTRCDLSRGDLLPLTLLKLSETWLKLADYAMACKLLQVALKKVSNEELKAEIHYLIGKCYLNLGRWSESWVSLHYSLCHYQSLPKHNRSKFCLARVRLVIAVLLLYFRRLPLALEQSQLALDLSGDLLADQGNVTSEYLRLNREAKALTESFFLVKVCHAHFSR